MTTRGRGEPGKDAESQPELTYTRLEEWLAEGPVELIRLSDEELVAADPLDDDARLAVTPFLNGLASEEERQLARACGLRALLSRQAVLVADSDTLQDDLVRAISGETEGVEVDLRLAPDLDLALSLRTGADTIVAVEQVTADDLRDWHYLYVHGERFCLQEAVAPAGQHTFSLLTPARARQQLVSLTDPIGVCARADADGVSQQVSAEQLIDTAGGPMAGVLGDSRLITQMLRLHPNAETTHGRLSVAYLTSEALWLVETDPDGAADPANLTPTTVRTLSARGLSDLVTEVVRA